MGADADDFHYFIRKLVLVPISAEFDAGNSTVEGAISA